MEISLKSVETSRCKRLLHGFNNVGRGGRIGRILAILQGNCNL
jgi:hypothetical protein